METAISILVFKATIPVSSLPAFLPVREALGSASAAHLRALAENPLLSLSYHIGLRVYGHPEVDRK